MSKLGIVRGHMQDIRVTLNQDRTNFLDPFWYNALVTRVEHVQSLLDEIDEPEQPALAPGKHEPEPILLPPKNRPVRPKKGA